MHEAIIKRRSLGPALRVAAAAVLFSTGGAAIKTASLSGLQVASLRSGIAAVALLIWFRYRLHWSAPVVGVGAVYASTLVLFVTSTKLTTAANAIFLQSTAPLYIVVLAPLLLRERCRPRDLLFLAAAAAGLALCLLGRGSATATAPDPSTGNVLGLLCSVSWAFTLMGLQWIERGRPGAALSAVVAGNAIAFVAGLPSLAPLPPASALDWATLAYLGVVQIGLAYVLLTGAVGRLPTFQISLLLLIEPVLNPMWTWALRAEHPGAWTLAGGALIVSAAAAQAALGARAALDRPAGGRR